MNVLRFILPLLALFLVFCQTPPDPAPEILVEEEEPEKPEPEVAEPVEVKEEPPKEELPKEEPIEEPPKEVAEEEPPVEEFVVSEEVFTETFEDIRSIIDELNAIIRSGNYQIWLEFLTEGYISHFSSAEVLRETSEQPLLKKYNINLRSLNDYFKYVVAPSRSNARLDDLIFIDNEHVKAIMIIKEQRTILYRLTKLDDNWKIDL